MSRRSTVMRSPTSARTRAAEALVSKSVILKTEALSVAYGSGPGRVVALNQVHFSARRGQLLCVSGVSGCGKSTLINVCAGIQVPDAGTVWVKNENITELADDARAKFRLENIGMIFQSDMLIDEFSAAENVAFPLELMGMSTAEAMSSSKIALEAFDIGDLADRFPGEMSGGQRQRVAVARCFGGDQRLLLADEPTASLDSRNATLVFEALRRAADNDHAVVAVSHDPRMQDYADVVVGMIDGEIRTGERSTVPSR